MHYILSLIHLFIVSTHDMHWVVWWSEKPSCILYVTYKKINKA